MKVGSTVKGLFTSKNLIIFTVIVGALVVLELVGWGISANADRVREIRAQNGGA